MVCKHNLSKMLCTDIWAGVKFGQNNPEWCSGIFDSLKVCSLNHYTHLISMFSNARIKEQSRTGRLACKLQNMQTTKDQDKTRWTCSQNVWHVHSCNRPKEGRDILFRAVCFKQRSCEAVPRMPRGIVESAYRQFLPETGNRSGRVPIPVLILT